MSTLVTRMKENPQWLLLWLILYSVTAFHFGSLFLVFQVAFELVASLFTIISPFCALGALVFPPLWVLLGIIGAELALLNLFKEIIATMFFSVTYLILFVECTFIVLYARSIYFVMYKIIPVRLLRGGSSRRLILCLEALVLFILFPIAGPLIMLIGVLVEKLTGRGFRG